MKIGKYSFGVGDRFAHEGINQLKALIEAEERFGVRFVPVWNKSNREHQIVGTEPMETRLEADAAVNALGYEGQYFVDADHINLTTVDRFIEPSDFFTIDVADYIGKVGGMEERFLPAIKEAGRIYRYIAGKKGADNFVTEVSMDEVDEAQTPIEMFLILSALAGEKVPAQTIAPKFTGRFNKGVDYVGNVAQFTKEFEQDLLVIDFAVKEFGLPDNLKLSIHSGSDKFTIYPIMGDLIRKYDKGIHVKTAGTSWLEELIGLAMADDAQALKMAKAVYKGAYGRFDELCAPYATVIDIDRSKLPTIEEVESWSGKKFADTLRHIPGNKDYNPNFRQLIHVGYKVAAELGKDYTDALSRNKAVCAEQVISNIYERHILRMFKK